MALRKIEIKEVKGGFRLELDGEDQGKTFGSDTAAERFLARKLDKRRAPVKPAGAK